jgi:hypothetical protein
MRDRNVDGNKTSKSASHSPARKRKTGHSGLEKNVRTNEVKVLAETVILLRTLPVGFRDVFVKVRIISEK